MENKRFLFAQAYDSIWVIDFNVGLDGMYSVMIGPIDAVFNAAHWGTGNCANWDDARDAVDSWLLANDAVLVTLEGNTFVPST